LRIAREAKRAPIQNLKHVISVSPVLDPGKATDRIENSYYIHRYFLNKWRRSLRKKQTLFPDLYDFSDILPLNSIRKITDALIERYSNLKSTDDYFKGYTLVDGDLNQVAVPTTLVIAEDDPIIAIEEFNNLQLNSETTLLIQHYGGHNGFITGFSLESWYEAWLLALFDDIVYGENDESKT